MRFLWVGAGGFAGAIARYAVDGFVSNRVRGAFPWGTFAVNVSGTFVLGLIFAALTERYLPHPTVRLALTTGFLGAYTTFSTYMFETMRLAEDGAKWMAAGNILAGVAAGLIAVVAGTWLGRSL